MRRRTVWIAILLCCVAGCAMAQPQQYRIAGRVVDAVNGQPLANTVISIGLATDQATTMQQLLTGADGAFALTGLAEGKYWLAGEKPEYRRQPFEEHVGYFSGIAVGPGKDSSSLVFRLHPSATLTGTIVDDESEPVPDAEVFLFYEEAAAATPQIYLAARTSTDVHGAYRFDDLIAGRYYLAVAARPWYAVAAESILAGEENKNPATHSLFDRTYPVTLYPGGYEEESTAPLALVQGQETVANMALPSAPAARLKIRIAGNTPEHAVAVRLQRKVFNFLFEAQQVPHYEEDAYSVDGLPIGRYLLRAEEYGPKARRPRALTLDVPGDLEIDLAAAHEEAIRGTILGGAGAPSDVVVRLWNQKTGQMMDAQIEAPGAFVFPVQPAPGTYAVYVLGQPYSVVESIAATRATVIGQSVVLTGAAPVELKIRMCTTAAAVEGVATRDSKPEAGLMIVLVPDDAEHDLPKYRRDQSDSDGTFALKDVIPGHYRIVVLEDGWNREWMRLAQDKLRQGAFTEVSVAPSSRQNVNVSLR